jgi:hypothetical protein
MTERWNDFMRRKKEELADGHFDENSYLFENEFSWTWALKGERPPPTAIIARRDTVRNSYGHLVEILPPDPTLHVDRRRHAL